MSVSRTSSSVLVFVGHLTVLCLWVFVSWSITLLRVSALGHGQTPKVIYDKNKGPFLWIFLKPPSSEQHIRFPIRSWIGLGNKITRCLWNEKNG